MKTWMLSLLALPLCGALTGCMKYDDYELPPQANGCKISTMHLFGNGGGAPVDTARFTWSGDNITRVSLNNYHYDIEYNGALVTRRTFYSGNSPVPFRYDRFSYDANFLFSGLDRFEEDNNGIIYHSDSTTLQYGGGFLRGFTQWTSSAPGQPLLLSRRKEFTYNGSNLSETREIEFRNGSPVDTTVTAVVTNGDTNWFQAINTRFWAVGPLFAVDDIDAIEISLMRNALERETVGGLPRVYSYTLDAKGNVGEHKVNGVPAARYFYNCP